VQAFCPKLMRANGVGYRENKRLASTRSGIELAELTLLN
jgi:hypothetical protein